MTAPPARPSFAAHVLLLWRLRATIAFNQHKSASRALAVAAFAASTAPAWGLAAAGWALLRWPQVASSPAWSAFALNLLCFVSAAVSVSWPILSAGVDDHSELSRYAAFPISGARLLFASSLASLFEPRSIVIYAPVAGAAAGYVSVRDPAAWPLALGLFALYLVLNVAWGRVGLHVVLNVLRGKRSAEAIGGFFVGVLLVCSLIPPVDTRWLGNLGRAGLGALNLAVLENAARALGHVPPGFLGAGLEQLCAGHVAAAAAFGAGMAGFAIVGIALAYRLLLAFYAGVGRAGAGAGAGGGVDNPFARTRTRFRTLLVRELLDVWKNPKARLLASAPFLLAILFKLVSGRDLVAFAAGATADAWILGSLCIYGAVVMGSTLSQNMFGYDGHGLAVFLAAPMAPGDVLRAKNWVHAGAALLMGILVCAFCLIYFRTFHAVDVACALAAVACVVPVLLLAGNFLSVYFPVKFHASLKRRDRIPFAASMLGVLATGVGTAPFAMALRADGKTGATFGNALAIGGCALVAWAFLLAFGPLARRTFEARRESVLLAVARG